MHTLPAGKEGEKLNSDGDAKEKIKYTFMGWDRRSLPLLYRGLGATFPAIFTHKSEVCKLVANLFAPMFDHGTRAEAVAQILLGSHSLEQSRLWYLHERLNEAKLASADMSRDSSVDFSGLITLLSLSNASRPFSDLAIILLLLFF